MFRSKRSQEQFGQNREQSGSPETRKDEVKKRERGVLERLGARGKEWLKIVGLASLSTVLVEGVFSSEARADDLSIQETVNLLAKSSDQPTPFELIQLTDKLTSLGHLPPNTLEDKMKGLMPTQKQQGTPGIGMTHNLAQGVDLRTSVDPIKEGAYALLKIRTDFL